MTVYYIPCVPWRWLWHLLVIWPTVFWPCGNLSCLNCEWGIYLWSDLGDSHTSSGDFPERSTVLKLDTLPVCGVGGWGVGCVATLRQNTLPVCGVGGGGRGDAETEHSTCLRSGGGGAWRRWDRTLYLFAEWGGGGGRGDAETEHSTCLRGGGAWRCWGQVSGNHSARAGLRGVHVTGGVRGRDLHFRQDDLVSAALQAFEYNLQRQDKPLCTVWCHWPMHILMSLADAHSDVTGRCIFWCHWPMHILMSLDYAHCDVRGLCTLWCQGAMHILMSVGYAHSDVRGLCTFSRHCSRYSLSIHAPVFHFISDLSVSGEPFYRCFISFLISQYPVTLLPVFHFWFVSYRRIRLPVFHFIFDLIPSQFWFIVVVVDRFYRANLRSREHLLARLSHLILRESDWSF